MHTHETKYIIDPSVKFTGACETTITHEKGTQPKYVDYSSYLHNDDKGNLTFEEYKKKLNKPQLIIIDPEEMQKKYWQPYYDSLKSDWSEITEKRFNDLLECLPPQRWTSTGRKGSFFFMMEAYTADLHTCCVQIDEKYYSSLRSIKESSKSIIESLPKD
jgi:hypothetical protein